MRSGADTAHAHPIQCLPASGNRAATRADAEKMGQANLDASWSLRAERSALHPEQPLGMPLKILALSSSHSGTVSIHCTAGLLALSFPCRNVASLSHAAIASQS